MNLFHALIFGLVEGVTEFLPVSSTGHLMLAARLLGLSQNDFLKSFEISIQLGAILAVVVLYGRRFMLNPEIIKRLLAAFIPTALLGSVLYKLIKSVLLSNHQIVLWSLFLGGVFLIVFEIFYREKAGQEGLTAISYPQAFLIGVFQSLAIVPGVSRAAATIVGGLLLGVKRKDIVEFSFLLAVPTMLAATIFDLLKSGCHFSSNQSVFLAIGFISSFLVAVVSIKFLLYFIQRSNFIPFGVYRVVIALLFWFSTRN